MAIQLHAIDERSKDPWVRAAVDNAPPLTAEANRLIADAFRPVVQELLEQRRKPAATSRKRKAA